MTNRPMNLQPHAWRLRRAVAVGVLLAVTAAMGVGAALAGSGNNLLRTLGDETFVPNVQVQANLKFSPGNLRIASGDTLTIEHADATEAPHTLTVVGPEELPGTIEELFGLSTCPTCHEAIGAHMGGELVVDSDDSGFNEVGDSILFFHGASVEIDVTADPGTTLTYICVIHPWMQGTIDVT